MLCVGGNLPVEKLKTREITSFAQLADIKALGLVLATSHDELLQLAIGFLGEFRRLLEELATRYPAGLVVIIKDRQIPPWCTPTPCASHIR
ncbi:hypothetical protein J2W42_006204 [Rhizobium tibeticum]|nr:hypothetical protein [Rhizobium tibeticum]